MITLGIDTSCDDTSAAVLHGEREILSNIVSSQEDLHRRYGGVVPELASRSHLEQIVPVIRRALEQAYIKLCDVDLVAVTCGPGLVGSLLVGLSTAKGICFTTGKPLAGVNHLRGHMESIFLSHPKPKLPAISLVVSGGHTEIHLVSMDQTMRTLGRARDDAAGEAFDKVAKRLGLGYPGGPVVEQAARGGREDAYTFRPASMSDGSLDFSFSGLKSAVVRAVADDPSLLDPAAQEACRDLLASFQWAAIRSLLRNTLLAAKEQKARSVFVSGGVSANALLRERFTEACSERGIEVYFPNRGLTSDNGAMIAAAGVKQFTRKGPHDLALDAVSKLKLTGDGWEKP
jgi:N6-L-threonylcarbamoyladenine synthase